MLISDQLIKTVKLNLFDKCRIVDINRNHSKYKKRIVCSKLVITIQERGYQGRVSHKNIKMQI